MHEEMNADQVAAEASKEADQKAAAAQAKQGRTHASALPDWVRPVGLRLKLEYEMRDVIITDLLSGGSPQGKPISYREREAIAEVEAPRLVRVVMALVGAYFSQGGMRDRNQLAVEVDQATREVWPDPPATDARDDGEYFAAACEQEWFSRLRSAAVHRIETTIADIEWGDMANEKDMPIYISAGMCEAIGRMPKPQREAVLDSHMATERRVTLEAQAVYRFELIQRWKDAEKAERRRQKLERRVQDSPLENGEQA